MKVLITCGAFEPGFRGGGPVRSVARIIDTAPPSIDVTLVTRDRDLGSATPYPGLSGRWAQRGRARVFYLDTARLAQWLRLRRELGSIDLLYVNSLWSPLFTVLPVLAAWLRLIHVRRVLVAPRGELSPGALALKARKKRLFLALWGRLLRRMDVTWHASAAREASEIRAVLPWARVEVVPNQVALPFEPLPPSSGSGSVARFVFVGRISPKKNLHLALAALRHVTVPVEFDIYGPIEDRAYWASCESVLGTARYRGALDAADVCRTFAQYDAFVFPTLGENFGHVIAESLSVSCPVVCSAETPWTPVLEAGGGVVVRSLTPAALATELDRLATLSPDERHKTRLAAGEAYRTWRATADGPNILDHILNGVRDHPVDGMRDRGRQAAR